MKTFIITNNKTKHGAILQTEKTREELWQEVVNDIDTILEKENSNIAIKTLQDNGFEIVPFDNFYK